MREPIAARASATVMVNWSTLRRSPRARSLPRIVRAAEGSSAVGAHHRRVPAAKARQEHRSRLVRGHSQRNAPHRIDLRLGQGRRGSARHVSRGAAFRPAASGRAIADVPPLQQRPIPLQAQYFEAYGSLTRGGEPLREDARIEFPHDGVGFALRDTGEYRGVVKEGFRTTMRRSTS